jgi:polysaccharide export outer membrane protein
MKYLSNSSVRLFAIGSVCLAGLILLAGCASGGAGDSGMVQVGPPGSKLLSSNESSDALRVGEFILIEFSGVDNPPARHEERIKLDGRITLPSIGPIEAAGHTRGELEDIIRNLYVPRFYRQLTVIVRNEGRFFYVGGQVRNPNRYEYLREMTVLKAIATAGDFTDFAKKTKVLVTRADGRKLTVNCIKAIRDQKLDLPLYPDDSIFVPRRYF